MADDTKKPLTKEQREQREARAKAQAQAQETERAAQKEATQDSDRPEPQPMDDISDADPTNLSDPNQFGTSADAASEVDMPPTKIVDAEAGKEVRPEKEPVTLPNETDEQIEERASKIYGRHSGKVGHAVPIVDDYTVNNPRAGGQIGGANGPGAVGRVAAERIKTKAAKEIIDALADGVKGEKQLRQEAEREEVKQNGTPYRVIRGAIHTANGKHVPGDKVYLTAEQARKFDKVGRLGPWIE